MTDQNLSSARKVERLIMAFVALASAFTVAYISLMGPLFLKHITYRSSLSGIYQFMGQDGLNLFFVVPLLLLASYLLAYNKALGRSVMAFLSLYMIYFGLSYVLGVEWASGVLSGNSEGWVFLYIGIVISGLLMLLYSFDASVNRPMAFSRKALTLYTTMAGAFTALFALSYIQGITANLASPTDAYLSAPALFWFVKVFDLCFSVPLMAISIYLLWTRPQTSFTIQILSYGFFITMTSAVNAMAVVMAYMHDPGYSAAAHGMFIALEAISLLGFGFILRGMRQRTRP